MIYEQPLLHNIYNKNWKRRKRWERLEYIQMVALFIGKKWRIKRNSVWGFSEKNSRIFLWFLMKEIQSIKVEVKEGIYACHAFYMEIKLIFWVEKKSRVSLNRLPMREPMGEECWWWTWRLISLDGCESKALS